MSSMVPFWASTDSVFVPNWDPHPKPRCPEEVVYIPKDSCSHFTQRLSLWNFLSNTHVLLITIHSHHSYLLYITFIRATIAFIYMTYSHFHFPRLAWQAGCPRSFVSDTVIKLTLYFTTFWMYSIVPRSQSGAVPISSLLSAGSWGSGKLERVVQLGEGWGK